MLPAEPDLAAEDAAGGGKEGGGNGERVWIGPGERAGVGDTVEADPEGGDDYPGIGEEGVFQGGVGAVFVYFNAVVADVEIVEEGTLVDFGVIAKAYADVGGVAEDLPATGDEGGVRVFGVAGAGFHTGCDGEGGEEGYQGRQDGAFHDERFMLGLDRKYGVGVA